MRLHLKRNGDTQKEETQKRKDRFLVFDKYIRVYVIYEYSIKNNMHRDKNKRLAR